MLRASGFDGGDSLEVVNLLQQLASAGLCVTLMRKQVGEHVFKLTTGKVHAANFVLPLDAIKGHEAGLDRTNASISSIESVEVWRHVILDTGGERRVLPVVGHGDLNAIRMRDATKRPVHFAYHVLDFGGEKRRSRRLDDGKFEVVDRRHAKSKNLGQIAEIHINHIGTSVRLDRQAPVKLVIWTGDGYISDERLVEGFVDAGCRSCKVVWAVVLILDVDLQSVIAGEEHETVLGLYIAKLVNVVVFCNESWSDGVVCLRAVNALKDTSGEILATEPVCDQLKFRDAEARKARAYS